MARIDGAAKVTGQAAYAIENDPAGVARAAVLTSTIAAGRIRQVGASDARRVADTDPFVRTWQPATAL